MKMILLKMPRHHRNTNFNHSFFPKTSSLYMMILPKKSVEEGKVRRRELVVRGWGSCRVWGVPTSSRGQGCAICHPLLPSSCCTSTMVSAAPQNPPWGEKAGCGGQHFACSFCRWTEAKKCIISLCNLHILPQCLLPIKSLLEDKMPVMKNSIYRDSNMWTEEINDNPGSLFTVYPESKLTEWLQIQYQKLLTQ